MSWLGIDIGGSETRFAWTDGTQPQHGTLQGTTAAQGTEALITRLTQIRDKVPNIRSVVLSVTGADSHDLTLRAAIAAELGVSKNHVALFSDAELALRAYAPQAPGSVLIAGTGAIALGWHPDGTIHRAGGRGIGIDDAGSGAWIGREALAAFWHAEESGAPLTPPLFAALSKQFPDWSDCRAQIYGGDHAQLRRTLGRLAQITGQAAQSGDPVALGILQRASNHLADLIQRLQAQTRPAPVAALGRVWSLHPILSDTVSARVSNISFPNGAQTGMHLATVAARMAQHLETS